MSNLDKLAAILAAYHIDAPYTGEWADESPDPTSLPEVKEWLQEEHCGDCTNLPLPCLRCYAEEFYCEAKFILMQMGDVAGE